MLDVATDGMIDFIRSCTLPLIDDRGDTVRVYYAGIRPDAFRAGAQAVVEGRYAARSGQFEAELLQAKCPSKYEVGVAGAEYSKSPA